MGKNGMKRHVSVLLSSYNGEKYIEEQIESVWKQKDVEVSVLVRDDGSKDSTLSILDRLGRKGDLSHYTGGNMGPARSFMQLLKDAGDDEYYAFCDQDDFWKPEKLSVAVGMLEESSDVPALYVGQTQLADAALSPLPTTPIHPLLTFGESLVYEFAAGCTMVMNRKLRDIAVSHTPSYLKMHDVWVYSIALAIGAKVVFDPEPHILYRQHTGNAVGQGFGITEAWKRRLRRIFNGEHSRYRRAVELREGFLGLMPGEERLLLEQFIAGRSSMAKRFGLMRDPRLRCSDHDVYKRFRLALLLNLY